MKPKRVRDFKAEYRRRIASGKARGYSRAQASGHPNLKVGESAITAKNKTAFPQDTLLITDDFPVRINSKRPKPFNRHDTLLMVVSSPCIGCGICTSPQTCVRLDEWLQKSTHTEKRIV